MEKILKNFRDAFDDEAVKQIIELNVKLQEQNKIMMDTLKLIAAESAAPIGVARDCDIKYAQEALRKVKGA